MPSMAPMKLTDSEIKQTSKLYKEDFIRLASLFSSITTQFGGQEGLTYIQHINNVSALLIACPTSRKQNEDAAKLLFTAFQKILSDRSPLPNSRKQIVFKIANRLFKLYFRLQVIRQFDSISKNIVSSGVVFGGYGRGDKVGYRYYMGRYYLSQQQYSRARAHLLWSFNNCTNSASGNKRLILIYLITASLPLAILPSEWLLGLVPDVEHYFSPLVLAIKKGNYGLFHSHLNNAREWFDKYEVWWYLNTRCDLLLWRSLARRTFLLSGTSSRTQPTLRLSLLLTAMRVVTGDKTYDLDDAENVAVTLIDTGYVKGYIHHVQKLLVLDRRDERTFGFVLGNGAGRVARVEDDDEERFS